MKIIIRFNKIKFYFKVVIFISLIPYLLIINYNTIFGYLMFSDSELITITDKLYDLDRYRERYPLLKKAYDMGNRNPEILWRLARAIKEMTDDMPNNEEKIKMLYESLYYIRMATKLDPNNKLAVFWEASIWGTIGETAGPLNAAFLLIPIIKTLKKGIALDPDYGDCYYVLGAVYFKGISILSIIDRKYFLSQGISLIRKAIYLYENGLTKTDIASLYYRDIILSLLKRNYDLKKKKKLWKKLKKLYEKAKTPLKKALFFEGYLDEPVMNDKEEALFYYRKLLYLEVRHRWDVEMLHDLNKIFKFFY